MQDGLRYNVDENKKQSLMPRNYINKNKMKKILIALICCWIFSGCSIFRRHEKYGCPSNGKNIGAERVLSGDKAAIKASKKAAKFKK